MKHHYKEREFRVKMRVREEELAKRREKT